VNPPDLPVGAVNDEFATAAATEILARYSLRVDGAMSGMDRRAQDPDRPVPSARHHVSSDHQKRQ
jgi:hypothetical protein